MSEENKSVAYRLGQFVGTWPKTMGAVLIVGLGLVISNAIIENKQIEAEEGKLRQAASDRQTKAAQMLELACGANFLTLQSQASVLLKAGNANKAFELVEPCNIFPKLSAPARAFIQSTSKAATLESAAVNRISIAKQEAEAKKVALAERVNRRKEGVTLGMSKQQVMDSSWGKPRKVNRTIGANYEKEQWVYDGGYLYFRDGELTTIQN